MKEISFSPPRPLGVIALGGLIIVVLSMLVGYWEMQQDDSYIYYTYARNLANGHGYVFNIGERVNATTSPLYTILLALSYKMLGFLPFVSLPVIGRMIGCISLLLLCIFLIQCFRDGEERLFPYSLPLVLLANPLLSNAFGLELFLALMLAVASLALYVKKKIRAASLVVSLAVLARPDMLIVAGLLLIHYIISRRRVPDIVSATLFILPTSGWLVFSCLYFGSLLPATLAAKLAQTEAELWGSGNSFLQGFFSGLNWYGAMPSGSELALLVTLLFTTSVGVLIGIVIIITKYREWSILRSPAFQILVMWGVLHFVAYGFVLKTPAYSWYYSPLALGIAAVMTLPLEGVYRRIAHRSPSGRHTWSASVLVALTLAGTLLPLMSFGNKSSWEFDTHREAAQWLNEHADEGASVGANDIDVLRYYYMRGPVVDGLGLVTPEVTDHVRHRDFDWFILEYEPDYLMLPHQSRSETEGFLNEEWFKQRYDLQAVIGEPGRAVAIYEKFHLQSFGD